MTITAPPQPQPPPFTPKRTLPPATTWAQLQAALGNLQPGDTVTAKGVHAPPEATISRQLSAPAQVIFDSGCRFVSGGATNLPAIWFPSVANLRFIFQPGCVISNPKQGGGILVYGAANCVFDGFNIDQIATSAFGALPVKSHIENSYFRGTVANWALVPSLDPHLEKGTGLHGFLASDTKTGYLYRNNTMVLTTPGSVLGGSLLEIGDAASAYAPSGNKAWLDGSNLLQDAKIQTAGNVLNIWGYIGTLEVLWLHAQGCHGRGVQSHGALGSMVDVKVDSGLAANCCLNPYQKLGSPWDKYAGVQYGTVTPLA